MLPESRDAGMSRWVQQLPGLGLGTQAGLTGPCSYLGGDPGAQAGTWVATFLVGRAA